MQIGDRFQLNEKSYSWRTLEVYQITEGYIVAHDIKQLDGPADAREQFIISFKALEIKEADGRLIWRK